MDLKIVNIESLISTNSYLFDLAGKQDAEEGLVIITDNQTAGKGLGNNTWESQAGKNLTFSILIKPGFLRAEQQFVITQLVSLAILGVCKKILGGDYLKIKWPNDIYAGNKKLAGILIQNIVKGNSISYSIIGIGLNVNQQVFVSDAPNPVSMIQLLGEALDRGSLLDEILNEFDNAYSDFMKIPETIGLDRNFIDNLYGIGESRFFIDKDGRFEGMIVGVNDYGQLLIKKAEGSICVYAYKEVEFEL